MKKAKVIYNAERDTFEIHTNTGDGWGLNKAWRCYASNKEPMGDANYIHFSVLKELALLEYWGYEINFKLL